MVERNRLQIYVDTINQTIVPVYDGLNPGPSFERLTKDTFKAIESDLYLEESDLKIQCAALKALVRTPWREEINERVSAHFISIAHHLNPVELSSKRLFILDTSFDNILDLSRSRSGTSGVYFVNCKPTNLSSKNYFVIKLVAQNEKERFILADRFYTSLGYTTPGTKCVTESRNIRAKLGKVVEKKCAVYRQEAKKFQLHQTKLFKEDLEQRNTFLVMGYMSGVSFEDIEEEQLLPLLDNPLFLRSLGEMIFIDAFIGNTDRFTSSWCNLGNVMVNDHDLILIDQKFCLGFPVNEGEDLGGESLAPLIAVNEQIIGQKAESKMSINLDFLSQGHSLPLHEGNGTALLALLNGLETWNILKQFQKELNGPRRADAGSIVLEDTQLEVMIGSINEGIKLGLQKIVRLLSNSHATAFLLCQPEFKKPIQTACALSEKLLSLGKKK